MALVAGGVSGAHALDPGAAAPEIEVTDLAGAPVSIEALHGRVVVVDFWASWCACCAQQIPALERIRGAHQASGLVVVGISEDESDDAARRFISHAGARFVVARDAGHHAARRYAPRAMPTTYVIDRRGDVRFVHEGFREGDAARIEAEIVALLAEPSP
jgi:peroxiredoxin